MSAETLRKAAALMRDDDNLAGDFRTTLADWLDEAATALARMEPFAPDGLNIWFSHEIAAARAYLGDAA